MAVGASDMTQHITPHRFAGAAIAAVLALAATPAWAQETAPVADPAAPGVVQPSIVLPDVTAAPVAPLVVAPVPGPVAAAPVVERAAPRNAAPVARSAPAGAAVAPFGRAETAPLAPVDTLTETPVEARGAAIEPVAATPLEEAALAAPADDAPGDILPLAGLLAALGLGGIALFAARRRRRQPDEVAPAIVAREPAPLLPSRPASTTRMPAPNFVAPALSLQRIAQPSAEQTVRPAWQEPRRVAVAPAFAQSSHLNRQALLERMVAAEPDANNPFTSGKARRRRARLMLQSMDNRRWDDSLGAELTPGFDWRELARAARERETVSA